MATCFGRMADVLMAAVMITLLAKHGNSACEVGKFGFRCRFQCYCRDNEICDKITGKCPSDCPDGRWGVGCMLSNAHYYNDRYGRHYQGKLSYASHVSKGETIVVPCKPWTLTNKRDSSFPDGSRELAKNYCRSFSNGPYCYYSERRSAHCNVTARRCPVGRFDINCVSECHCNDDEDCQQKKKPGECDSNCAGHFTGFTCQECKDGFFGAFCEDECRCASDGCDRVTGYCPKGCIKGWTGDSCQIAPKSKKLPWLIITVSIAVPSLAALALFGKNLYNKWRLIDNVDQERQDTQAARVGHSTERHRNILEGTPKRR